MMVPNSMMIEYLVFAKEVTEDVVLRIVAMRKIL